MQISTINHSCKYGNPRLCDCTISDCTRGIPIDATSMPGWRFHLCMGNGEGTQHIIDNLNGKNKKKKDKDNYLGIYKDP